MPPRAKAAPLHPLGATPGVIAALVLAGGASRRMRTDKIQIKLAGRPLLAHALDACALVTREVIVVGRDSPPAGISTDAASLWITDAASTASSTEQFSGPLWGLAVGLARTHADVAIVVGGDMPALRPELLMLLAQHAANKGRIVIPLHEGQPQPLCSAWPVTFAPEVAQLIAAGERSPLDAAYSLNAELLQPAAYAEADPCGDSFLDVDTPEELTTAYRLFGRRTDLAIER